MLGGKINKKARPTLKSEFCLEVIQFWSTRLIQYGEAAEAMN